MISFIGNDTTTLFAFHGCSVNSRHSALHWIHSQTNGLTMLQGQKWTKIEPIRACHGLVKLAVPPAIPRYWNWEA